MDEGRTESWPGSMLTAVEGILPSLRVTAGLGVQLVAGRLVPSKNTGGHPTTCLWVWLGRSCGQLGLSRAGSSQSVGTAVPPSHVDLHSDRLP